MNRQTRRAAIKRRISQVAPMIVAMSVPALASFAQTTTTGPGGNAANVNYASLFDAANITANLPVLGGYVAGTALAFGGISLTVRWIGKFLGH